jgi:hypothetical protein
MIRTRELRRWLIRGLLACTTAANGCAWHLPKLRHNTGWRDPSPKTLEDRVRDQANGTSWLHETVGLGPMILN